MTSVGVVIPWYVRGPDVWRDAALRHVLDWWGRVHPSWPLVLGTVEEKNGPWCKGLAVYRGLQQIYTDVVVVADADVICESMAEPVGEVAALRCGWAIPHRMVYRLGQDTTTLVYQDGWVPPLVPPGTGSPHYSEVYSGFAGGGLVVLPRRLIEEVPIDPRFTGWGQEDMSWARALTMVAGHPWRGSAPLLHFWHDPQPKISIGVGSQQGRELWQRYQGAATLPALLDLVEEARQILRDVTGRHSALPERTEMI